MAQKTETEGSSREMRPPLATTCARMLIKMPMEHRAEPIRLTLSPYSREMT